MINDPRIVVQTYAVLPTGYDEMVHADKDSWCLVVTNGHRWGWSISRGIGMTSGGVMMNRKGKFILESRGSGHNKARRYPLDEALEIALKYVDSITLNGHTAVQASENVAARKAYYE